LLFQAHHHIIHLVSEVLKINGERPDPERIAHAAHLIRAGQVVAIPTDTLYGLAADPFNLSAVDAVFRIKGRPGHKALLLMVNSIEQAEEISANLPPSFYKLARHFWPGPLTMVVPASRRVPRKIASDTGKVAIRLPNAAIPQALMLELDMPLTGTSANLTGEEPCTTAADVQIQLGDRIPLIIDGGNAGGSSGTDPALPSTVIDLAPTGWKVLREGAIPVAQILEFFEE
jgi:L-threonylcarbamoyladenylate synthase